MPLVERKNARRREPKAALISTRFNQYLQAHAGEPFVLLIQVIDFEDGVRQAGHQPMAEFVLEDRLGRKKDARAAKIDEGVIDLLTVGPR